MEYLQENNEAIILLASVDSLLMPSTLEMSSCFFCSIVNEASQC